jgi:hypothetical protein
VRSWRPWLRRCSGRALCPAGVGAGWFECWCDCGQQRSSLSACSARHSHHVCTPATNAGGSVCLAGAWTWPPSTASTGRWRPLAVGTAASCAHQHTALRATRSVQRAGLFGGAWLSPAPRMPQQPRPATFLNPACPPLPHAMPSPPHTGHAVPQWALQLEVTQTRGATG